MCRRSPRPRPAARQLTALTFAIGDPSRRWSGTCPRATRRSTRLRGKEEFGETRARAHARTHAGTQARTRKGTAHRCMRARACKVARGRRIGRLGRQGAVDADAAVAVEWKQTRRSGRDSQSDSPTERREQRGRRRGEHVAPFCGERAPSYGSPQKGARRLHASRQRGSAPGT